jgi:hypothetical protein
MTKDDAINILLDHLSAGLVRTLEDAIAKEEREECAKVIDAEAKETGLCAYYANLIRARG